MHTGITEETRAVLFDHDGTLIDSESLHYDLWCQVLANYNINLPFEFYQKVMAGVPSDKNAIDLIAQYGLDVAAKDLEREKLTLLSAYLDKQAFPLMPFAREAVVRAHEKGFLVAIVTGGTRASVERTLSTYGLASYIQTVVTVEDVTYSKPAPDCYLLALEQLGLTAAQGVAIEDTSHGARAAVDAGLSCIAIPTELSKEHDFSHATAIYPSMQQWCEDAGL